MSDSPDFDKWAEACVTNWARFEAVWPPTPNEIRALIKKFSRLLKRAYEVGLEDERTKK